jgi:hypothetical protein
MQNTLVLFCRITSLMAHGFTYLQVLPFPQQEPDLREAGSTDPRTEFWLRYRTAQSRYMKIILY